MCVPDKHSESGSLVVPENGDSLKKGIFAFITEINLQGFSTATFIIHNRSFIFIDYENE